MRKSSILQFVLLILAGFLFIGCGEQSPAVDFEMQPEVGDEIHYSLVQDMTMIQTIFGSEMTMNQKQTYEYIMRVLDVREEEIDSEFEYTRVATEMDMVGMGQEEQKSFDSSDPETGDEEMSSLAALVGKKILITTTRSGEVRSISGWDAVMDELMEEAPMEMRSQFEEMFDEEAMMGWMAEMAGYYDAGAVSLGDSWEAEFEMPQPVPLLIESTLTYVEAHPDRHELSYEASIKPLEDEETIFDVGEQMSIDFDLDGKYTGSVYIDRDTHMVLGWEGVMEAEGTMRMIPGEEAPPGMEEMEIPVDIKIDQSVDGEFI